MKNTGYFSKRLLVSAFKKGHLEDVHRQLVTYGQINSVNDWEVSEPTGTPHAGAWRKYKITHHDIRWEVKMHNGNIRSVTMMAS